MGAPGLLEHLRSSGLSVKLIDDKIIIAPRDRLTDPLREAILADREALVAELKIEAKPARRSSNPLMTVEQADQCHTPCWDDAEIASFTTRVLLFVRRGNGPTDADDLAERLVLRDRDLDDRRACLECANLLPSGRCAAAGRGQLAGADRHLEPVPTLLQRCEGFVLREGLTWSLPGVRPPGGA